MTVVTSSENTENVRKKVEPNNAKLQHGAISLRASMKRQVRVEMLNSLMSRKVRKITHSAEPAIFEYLLTYFMVQDI
jgi:hypothetical protein